MERRLDEPPYPDWTQRSAEPLERNVVGDEFIEDRLDTIDLLNQQRKTMNLPQLRYPDWAKNSPRYKSFNRPVVGTGTFG